MEQNQNMQRASGIASELIALKSGGALTGEIEEYLTDPEFVALLREMPAKAAVTVYESRKKCESEYLRGVEDGKNEALETLRTRRAMPMPIKAGISASAEPDFAKMSSADFESYKKRLKGM